MDLNGDPPVPLQQLTLWGQNGVTVILSYHSASTAYPLCPLVIG